MIRVYPRAEAPGGVAKAARRRGEGTILLGLEKGVADADRKLFSLSKEGKGAREKRCLCWDKTTDQTSHSPRYPNASTTTPGTNRDGTRNISARYSARSPEHRS